MLGAFQLMSAQNINSPYSMFGIGAENNVVTGGMLGLANSGIAQRTYNEMNVLNPANLGNILPESFIQDIGFYGLYSDLQNDETSQTSLKGNLSHAAFAFPVSKEWGLSLGIVPYTTTGYKIDVESYVDGYPDTFLTRYVGTGGISDFFIATGAKLNKRLSVGTELSVLFGSLKQETQVTTDFLVNIYDENRYSGLQITLGAQYDVIQLPTNRTTIGTTIELPTSLNGTQTRYSQKTSNSGVITTIEEENENMLSDYNMPLSIGIGLSSSFQKLTANLDYKRKFWEDTQQHGNDERYTNQSMYALGVEYVQENKNASYFTYLKYRFGLNYNTGYLEISDKKIDSYYASLGIGFPINRSYKNSINIAYSYGKEGTVESNLIQENYHKLSINLSFNGNWFRKAKIQ